MSRLSAVLRRLLGPRPPASSQRLRTATTTVARGKPPAALPSRVATRALPPAAQPTWMTDPAYLHMARQLLGALGSRRGGRNRAAAAMSRALWEARDPGVELQRLCEESKTVLRLLGELRLEQVRQAWQAKADAEAEAQAIELAPLQAIAQRSR